MNWMNLVCALSLFVCSVFAFHDGETAYGLGLLSGGCAWVMLWAEKSN
jgi:hypothetical protein